LTPSPISVAKRFACPTTRPVASCFHFASLYGGTGSSNPVRSTPEEVLRRRWRLVD
jgi:hypothetical protein